MAISKRTRFEILRRDNHTCRYCGSSAPDVKLHVDHVTPTALGGTDDPANLVAACVDCNFGKASTSPDESTVADVADFEARWRLAMSRAAEIAASLTSDERAVVDAFDEAWSTWTWNGGQEIPRSPNWRVTVLNYWRSGLPASEILAAVDTTMRNEKVSVDGAFPYFCGVARNKVKALSEVAAQLMERGEV